MRIDDSQSHVVTKHDQVWYLERQRELSEQSHGEVNLPVGQPVIRRYLAFGEWKCFILA